MYKIISRICALYLFIAFAVGQLRSELPAQSLPVNVHGISHARNTSFFDLNRLSVSNSFGMSMTSFGNQSISMGSYNSHIDYLINDKVRLSSQFTLMAPMNGLSPNAQNGLNGAKVFYDTAIDYRPTENMIIKFSMNNYPRYYRNPYSRLLLRR